MRLRFRRMSEEDYDKEATRLMEAANAYSAFELADNASKSNHFDTSYLNARYYFGLSHYVVNEIFAGSRLSNIYKLLGLTQEKAKGITDFTLCYTSDGELESVDASIMSNKGAYVGGDAVYHMIMDLDQNAIDNAVVNIFDGAYRSNKLPGYTKISFTTQKPANGVELVPGIWVDLGSGTKYEGLEADIAECIFVGGKSLASRAYALWSRGLSAYKEMLLCSVSKQVLLMPRSMRTIRMKGTTKQYDPLDAMYKNCYNANLLLSRIYAAAENYSNYIGSYKRLQNAYTTLTSKRANEDNKRKSLMARLSTKTGQIRGTNLGKRLDYSGRSVIVVNPFMSLRNIGLPKRVIPKLYAYDIFDSMSKDLNADISPEDWAQQRGETMRNTGNAYIAKHPEIISRAPLPIGRQPTLHKGSITAYYPIPTDNIAIELSPLVCPPFNADFDGDQMWYMNNLSDEAKREATELLLGVKNPFWAKDGAPTMVPRQEIIYGLNTCTKPSPLSYESAINVTPEEAYKLITTNSKPVTATGCYTNASGSREYATLGLLAYDYCIKDIADLMKFRGKGDIRHRYMCICPICLSTGSKDGTLDKNSLTCPTHTGVQMRVLREFDVVHCRMCGKDSSAIDIGMEKNTSTEKAIREKITAFANNVRATNPLYSEVNNLYSAMSAIQTYRKLNEMHFSFTISYINNFMSLSEDEIRAQFAKGAMEASIEANKHVYSTTEEAMSTLGPVSYSFWDALRKLSVPVARELLKNLPTADMDLSTHPLIADALEDYLAVFDISLAKFRNEMAIDTPSMINPADLAAITRRCPSCSIVTSKSIASVVNKLLIESTKQGHAGDNTDIFTRSVDRLVKLGFVVAKYYAPSLDILTDINKNSPIFREEEAKFHAIVEKLNEYYDYGFMEDTTYNNAYQEALSKYGEAIKDNISKALGETNGFLRMVDSGARGSVSNLVQIYGFKGQVVKNSTESFNAVIDSCYAKQLSPFQHFLSTYGARRGIMDRSLETANTGYASRQLWHAMQGMVIRSEDCGTHDGVTITRAHIGIIDSTNGNRARDKENEWLVKFLTGRCKRGSTVPMTRTEATKWVESQDDNYTIRSPLTCANPCCKACYGIDLSTHDEVVVGTPIGIIGAQGIGETTSQLTMRTFQGGGVAKKGGIGSAFDHFETYVTLHDTHDSGDYEPTAWKSGYVLAKEYSKDTSKYIVTISDENDVVTKDTDWAKRDTVLVDKEIQLKHQVRAGEGFYVESADQFVPEIAAATDVYTAGLYLALKLFSIFRSECEINLKHFETLAACMTRALVLKTNNTSLNVGCTYSLKELLERGYKDNGDTIVRWGFYKVIDIPGLSPNAVANIDFESVGEGLVNIMAYSREEDFKDPIENIVFGCAPKVGSSVNPNYVDERSNFIVREDMV